jgi:hypothetical protein
MVEIRPANLSAPTPSRFDKVGRLECLQVALPLVDDYTARPTRISRLSWFPAHRECQNEQSRHRESIVVINQASRP